MMHPMTISLEQDFLFGSNSDQACSDILMPQHPFLFPMLVSLDLTGSLDWIARSLATDAYRM